MPNYRGHLAGGFIAFIITLCLLLSVLSAHLISCAQVFFYFICALAGSLFPDIDTKSRGQRYFYRVLSLILLFYIAQQNFYAVCVCAVVGIVPLLVNHRGIFHRSWFIVMITTAAAQAIVTLFPVYIVPITQGACFFLMGAFSHLALDFRPRLRRKRSFGRRRRLF